MTEDRNTFYARWLLRLSGGVVCLSVLAIFISKSAMGEFHEQMGMGELPDAPIVEYMARSLSAMYFLHGVVVLAISTNVNRYWPLVGVLGALNAFLGAVLTWVDFRAPMPWYWTACEGPPIAVLGAILLYFFLTERSSARWIRKTGN